MQEILAGGIRNLGKCASGIRNSSQDWNPESKFHWHRLESSTWNLESTAWNPESKTVLDSLLWGDKALKGIETKKLFNQHSYMVIFFLLLSFLLLKLSEHRLQVSLLNPKWHNAIYMDCLKNEQGCNIRFIIIHDYGFFERLQNLRYRSTHSCTNI